MVTGARKNKDEFAVMHGINVRRIIFVVISSMTKVEIKPQ
jgi:hypothetical protein